MILAASLLLVSGGLVVAGPRALGRLTRPRRHPLTALVAWQAVSWSVVGGVLLAAAMLAAPELAAVWRLPAGLAACLRTIDHAHSPADNPVVQTLAALLLAGVLFRLVTCGVRACWVTHSVRARHRALLSVVGHHEPRLDAHVVDDDAAIVYCLPGRGGCVVFTSGALLRLSTAQRLAVLAHERAHLRGRHDLLVAGAAALRSAFPRVRLFRQTWEQTVELIEMRADDIAGRRHGRRALAEALLTLTGLVGPHAVLGAVGTTTAMRIERLLSPAAPRPSSPAHCVGVAAVSILLAASPMLLAAAGHTLLCPA